MMDSDNNDLNRGLSGEEIVISGISGCFPSSEDVQSLIKNLYNKIDVIEYNKADMKHPELPKYSGNIYDLDKFDNQFFRFTKWQAASFDPLGRKTMESAYSAIFDAGINPETLKGTKLGVFIGTSQTDSGSSRLFNDSAKRNAFIISGCSKTMLANRISYWIDAKGPSYGLDYGCASSMACLEIAVERLKAGDCDSAIVGGCCYNFLPALSVNMRKAGLLCLDGKTKCFDKNGDGYVRSDAINMMFLQKAKDAKRIYTQIYHLKGKHFSKPDSLFLHTRKSDDLEKFFKEFYAEVDVSPNSVEYIEANASGISEADGNELVAIANIFSEMKPIKVGSIKSNIGNTEPASGICSLTKMCLSYQRGEIPGNLHYNEPQDQIAAIREGKVQVLTDNTKFDRSFTAVNNFSYTGANYHVLLKGHYKPKDASQYKSNIPYLVLLSGRLEKSVTKIFSILEDNPVDPEQLALLNNIFKYNIPGHTGRGYTIIDTNNKKTSCLAKGFELYDGNSCPIWFLYSGMGSQWTTMGLDFMRLPVFAEVIERCHKVLTPKGLDLIKIITADDKEIFNNIINSFVGITAIQIGLTEVLRSIGIAPDNIIGHSAGEMGCAYADGCLTLEEAILLSYLRGVVSLETKMIEGKMAAIGLSHEEVRKICPPEIDIACENSCESTTISGAAEDVEKFVAYLTERSIFARIVHSSGIAYHSRYMTKAGPSLLSEIRNVVKNPKPRSKLWLSTCFSPSQWSDERCLYASAEYFTHNLLSKVCFEEAAKLIPSNAVVIEVAPHGLMQAIMKRSHKSCLNLAITRRGLKDNVNLFLESVGKLYQAGLNPNIAALYPQVEFPVSTKTPVLSHLVDWDHTTVWHKEKYTTKTKIRTVSYEFMMTIDDDDYSFYKGSIRNGVNIFPEAAVLVIVWKTLAMYNKMNYNDASVEFTNVKFHSEVIINSNDVIKLLVEIQKAENFFEVTQNTKLIASGFINIQMNVCIEKNIMNFVESDYHLNEKDIYDLMSNRGYNYTGLFKSIKRANIERNKGLIIWNDNWVTFLDSLFQLNSLLRNHNGNSNLKHITRLVIDVEAHKEQRKSTFDLDKDICYAVQVLYDNAVTKCNGVTLTSIMFEDVPKITHVTKNLQIRQFLTYNSFPICTDLRTAIQVNLQIISEELKKRIVIHYKKSDLFSNLQTVLKQTVEDIPSMDIDIQSISTSFQPSTTETEPDVLILPGEGYEIDSNIYDNLSTIFVIVFGHRNVTSLNKKYNAVTKFKIGSLTMTLFEKSSSSVLDAKCGRYYYLPVQNKSKVLNIKLFKGISDDSDKCMWIEASSIPSNKTIQVVYSAVYTNECDNSADIYNQVNKYGTSFSGFNARGERVMGIASDGIVSSVVEANDDLIWPVPKYWTLDEAATVPLPYIQAFYCLKFRESLRRRSTVLITKGDSPLGQAAISLCLDHDCVVFTTVSDISKKKFLLKVFPEIDEWHIGLTNDLFFRHVLLRKTKNKRCDIVFNLHSGELRKEALKCVGPYNTFLDINEYDMMENNDYGMAFNTESKTYKSVRLSSIFLPEHSNDVKKLQLMLIEGIKNNSVKPLIRVVYSPDEITRAIKFLSTNYNYSSILINMKDPAILKDDFKTVPSIELSSSKSYIIVCDGTELGIELVDHLIQRGARRFLIHMKPKLMSGYFHVKYASWQKKDVIINFNPGDLHTKTACDTLITQGEQMGGVDGIFITYNELISETLEIKYEDNIDISLITSNLNVASRTCALNYFAILLYTSQDYNVRSFLKIEKCCEVRSEIGLPSLILRYESNNKKILSKALSELYYAMETSLKQNHTSVFLSDSEPKSRIYCDNETSIENGLGLGAFFNQIAKDECLATESVILMKTLLRDGTEDELSLDPDDPIVMLVPGFDGTYQAMTTVAERLKITAATLQLEHDFATNISEIAEKLLISAKKRFHMKSKFYLLGYSFGANVALELAALLEKEGRRGIVFCLDSSPDALKNQLLAYTGNMTDQQLQNSVIAHFYKLLTREDFKEFEDSTNTLEWSEKINMLVDKAKVSVTHTHPFLKSLVDVSYRRIKMAKAYDPVFKLESELVLIKGIPHPNSEPLSDDYGLSKFSNKPVKVFHLPTDHVTAPQDTRVSNIINKMLDPGLIKDFENKNVCQCYYE